MTPALQIDHLHKSFAGTKAVDDLSLTIEQGEIFGLLGPNGAGKSTTINMISGVCRVDSGTVRVFGHDAVRDYRLTRRLVGVMHQELITDHFFTIDRSLKIHAGYYGVRADNSWRELLIERLGLGPHLHKSMMKLSGGLKRRFMVAKALIHKPQLLILDEPTAGVDVELRRALWQFVREMNQAGTTVLLTTHYLEEAEQMCNRIAIMSGGKLVALERTADLLARLDSRSMLLHLDTPLDHVPVALQALHGQLEENGQQLRISLAGEVGMAEVLQLLAQLNLPIYDLELPRQGLEEVFLDLTGLQLSDRKGSPS
jgi:ABC-2 type transport system ATP-binding protein